MCIELKLHVSIHSTSPLSVYVKECLLPKSLAHVQKEAKEVMLQLR